MFVQKILRLSLIMLALFGLIWVSVQAQEATEEPMDDMDMEMDTGYSVDELAPLAMGYYESEVIYFIHPEASDETVAGVLTEMMGPDVYAVPSLAEIPAELLGNVYVFTNGIEAMGPLGFQSDVFDSIPSDENYTPLRMISLVTWAEGIDARELMSVEEIETAADAGELVIEVANVVVNMPILVWGEETR
jgi:hypothetical protein